MRKRDKVSMTEVAAQAPPVSAVEALRRNLLHAMFKGVTADDMSEIVSKQVEKARDGDGKAARLIIDMVNAGPSATHIEQMNVAHGDQHIAFISDVRRLMAQLVAAEGPLAPVEMAEKLHTPLPRILEAKEHAWFKQKKTRKGYVYDVTPQGRLEALGQKG